MVGVVASDFLDGEDFDFDADDDDDDDDDDEGMAPPFKVTNLGAITPLVLLLLTTFPNKPKIFGVWFDSAPYRITDKTTAEPNLIMILPYLPYSDQMLSAMVMLMEITVNNMDTGIELKRSEVGAWATLSTERDNNRADRIGSDRIESNLIYSNLI